MRPAVFQKLLRYCRARIFDDRLASLRYQSSHVGQKSFEFGDWIEKCFVKIVDEYVCRHDIRHSSFVKGMDALFNTRKFSLYLSKWIIDYAYQLVAIFHCHAETSFDRPLVLEKNSLNIFFYEKYTGAFERHPRIVWKRPAGFFRRVQIMISVWLFCLFFVLRNGVSVSRKDPRKYKLLREVMWGISGDGQNYFKDDFIVDGEALKPSDILFYVRQSAAPSVLEEVDRSVYKCVRLHKMPIRLHSLFNHVIPRYLVGAFYVLALNVKSAHFDVFSNLLFNFGLFGLDYEKLLSRYSVDAELAHRAYHANYVAENIVLESHGGKSYYMNWSDMSVKTDNHDLAFLGAAGFLAWGKAVVNNVEASPVFLVGYPFKSFILKVKNRKDQLCLLLKIDPQKKIVSFFDETFGGNVRMTVDHYMNFWRMIDEFSSSHLDIVVIIKVKDPGRFEDIPDAHKAEFRAIYERVQQHDHVVIVNPERWTFIEVIGLSDVVVTQGMTSSATIAIICGVQGLYCDEAGYDHPFNKFKGQFVFDKPGELLSMLNRILDEGINPCSIIPPDMLELYDACRDNASLDRIRKVLLGQIQAADFNQYCLT